METSGYIHSLAALIAEKKPAALFG
jgi:hypothetical protein